MIIKTTIKEAKESIDKRNIFILENMGLLNSFVNSFMKLFNYDFKENNYEDLINQGVISMICAIDRYNDSKSAKFPRYLYATLYHSLLRYCSECIFDVNIPECMYKKIKSIKNYILKMKETDGYVDYNAVANHFNLSINELLCYIRVIQNTTGFIRLDESNDETSLVDTIAEKEDINDCIQSNELTALLIKAINEILTKRQSEAITIAFNFNKNVTHTDQRVSEELGISRQAVTRLRKDALRTIYNSSYGVKLRDFY